MTTMVILTAACADGPTGSLPADEPATVQIAASVRSPTLSTLVVEVTAPDITNPLIFNFDLPAEPDPTTGERSVSGTLELPSGADRLFTVRAFNAEGIQTHEGQGLRDVQPGVNADPVVITLLPINGETEVTVVLGKVEVAVSPTTATIGLGGTVQLTASPTDGDGNPVAGAEVHWATLDPTVATVDPVGLVTGVGQGSVQIVATFSGVGDAADITVEAFPQGRDRLRNSWTLYSGPSLPGEGGVGSAGPVP